MARTLQQRPLTTQGPGQWPEPPTSMTVSTLAQIEACPRRWGLSAASYPDVWHKRGYPPRPNVRAIEGIVVHSSVERITKELIRVGCPSLQDAVAVKVLQGLGGYTTILTECIEQSLKRIAESPRIRGLEAFMAKSLRAKLPELRTRVQTLLTRARLPSLSGIETRDHTQTRRALPPGAFAEIEMRGTQIGWKGKADLLVVTSDGCEITDFKTGAPDPYHRFQMAVYGLLWSLDTDLNPKARPVKRLTLAYSDKDIEVPALTNSGLEEFKGSVRARGESACLAVAKDPPQARPSFNNCPHCTVRHLCGEYWTTAVQEDIGAALPNESFVDIELELTKQHGPKSWDAVVICSAYADPGNSALVRYSESPMDFQPGQRVRFLSVNVATDDHIETEQTATIVNMGALSEAFVVT